MPLYLAFNMTDSSTFLNHTELKELVHVIRNEIQQAQRPPNEIILDDDDVMRMLKISKRRLQYLKPDRILPYHKFDSSSPRTYYLLSDILEILKSNRIEALSNEIRVK